MHQSVTIASKYNGPPTTGNGGYVCGLLAKGIDGAAAVSLRVPPPLDTPLVLSADSGQNSLHAGDTLVGVAEAATLDLELPFDVEVPALLGALSDSYGLSALSPFSTCYVCGQDRHLGDGLCIYSHRIDGRDGTIAARWTLHPALADERGMVRAEEIWAALDCPGYFACAAGETALLARMTTRIITPMACEGEALVVGWTIAGTGRKRRCGTALYSTDGALHAVSEGLWIIVDPKTVKMS